MKKLFFFNLILFFTVRANPVVEVELPGLLDNRLFAYCVGKIIAEELGFKLFTTVPIW